MRRITAGLFCGATASALCGAKRALAQQTSQLVDVMPADATGHSYDYDLVVIGGGSGGLAAAKQAAAHGKKVAVCDFVTPSETRGTSWGIGGTCVNVGCIPKKLMHQAALVGEATEDATSYGWQVDRKAADWNTLVGNVTGYIRSNNFGYTVQLREKGIKYYNAYAKFVDPHTIECTNKKGETSKVSARRVLLATGGRPTLPNIPGAKEHGITSDDIFKLKEDPGNTLVVGASYVALECAGMLHGIGRRASVMMRSIPLRGFDQDMAEKVVRYMEDQAGIPFIRGVPTSLAKGADGKVAVTFKATGAEDEVVREYDTVLFATGRTPETSKIGLENAGVELDKSGKVVVDPFDRTSTPHIYAIGDIAAGGLELTPVAIRSGKLLADRLYAEGQELMDYDGVPTTVFTPLEYGCVGLTEERAKILHENDHEVYHTYFTPLEWSLPSRPNNSCYMKLIVQKTTDQVLGFHILSPNAGEITQGVAIAIRCGATKAAFDSAIGIHPTIAESMTTLSTTKSSGESVEKSGC